MRMSEYFVVTRVSREDIKNVYPKTYHDEINNLSDADMDGLARKLEDDYCNQMFWNSLRILSTELVKGEELK